MPQLHEILLYSTYLPFSELCKEKTISPVSTGMKAALLCTYANVKLRRHVELRQQNHQSTNEFIPSVHEILIS